MKRTMSIKIAILVFTLSILALTTIVAFQPYQAVAKKKNIYKIVEAGAGTREMMKKLGDPKHMERLLNVMAEEGWEYINVIPMTDLVIFKK